MSLKNLTSMVPRNKNPGSMILVTCYGWKSNFTYQVLVSLSCKNILHVQKYKSLANYNLHVIVLN
jgi:hypothetical protein